MVDMACLSYATCNVTEMHVCVCVCMCSDNACLIDTKIGWKKMLLHVRLLWH